jgi:acetyl esterase/lipase
MMNGEDSGMGLNRWSGSLAVVFVCASFLAAPPARAADQGITGKRLLLKSTPKFIVLSKDPAISIAGSNPVTGSDSSITFDDGVHTATLPLPAGYWSSNSSGTLFKYKNSSAPAGPSPVKIAKVKTGQLKLIAKGLPIPVPTGHATIDVVLRLDGGANTYCMTFEGDGDGTTFLVKDAAAGTCVIPTATRTATPTATPTPTSTPLPDYPHMTPPGAAPLRYRDAVFPNVTVTSNVQYGTAVNASNQTVILRLDIYEPTGDTITARPAIVWVHGGSFSGGDKTSPELVDEANTFAMKGYFNVSINYRLEPTGCSSGAPTPACATAIHEARDDAQTAIRFLRTNAALYGIDPTRIAIGGSSAGAITAMNVGFNSREVPDAAVAAAVSLSGARVLNGSAENTNDAPSLLLHGTADTVVPYQWAVNTYNEAIAAGLDSFLTSWAGAGHVPYVQHRTEILDQTQNFLYWEMDLANAAQ